jgi:hypothetical protein
MNTTNNPLKQFFRQPSIYIRLPSQGQYYPPGTLEMTANKEFPVYPMTAIDEITYRTPDALFNGDAVVSVIQSCLPNIKNAWYMPATDLDSILIAIRIASYGHELPFSSMCPSCGNEDERLADLRVMLDNMKGPDYSLPIKHGDMEIYLKPMTYKNLTDNNKSQYEEQRILSQIPTEGDDIEKIRSFQYTEILKKITEITIKALAQSISVIKTPQAQVTEQEYILELLANCERSLFNQIRDYIIEAKASAEMKPLDLECSSCKHKYQQAITLNMSDFFGDAS